MRYVFSIACFLLVTSASGQNLEPVQCFSGSNYENVYYVHDDVNDHTILESSQSGDGFFTGVPSIPIPPFFYSSTIIHTNDRQELTSANFNLGYFYSLYMNVVTNRGNFLKLTTSFYDDTLSNYTDSIYVNYQLLDKYGTPMDSAFLLYKYQVSSNGELPLITHYENYIEVNDSLSFLISSYHGIDASTGIEHGHRYSVFALNKGMAGALWYFSENQIRYAVAGEYLYILEYTNNYEDEGDSLYLYKINRHAQIEKKIGLVSFPDLVQNNAYLSVRNGKLLVIGERSMSPVIPNVDAYGFVVDPETLSFQQTLNLSDLNISEQLNDHTSYDNSNPTILYFSLMVDTVAYIIATDLQGDELWRKKMTYETDSIQYPYISMHVRSDGIIVYTNDYYRGVIFLQKYALNGDRIWSKRTKLGTPSYYTLDVNASDADVYFYQNMISGKKANTSYWTGSEYISYDSTLYSVYKLNETDGTFEKVFSGFDEVKNVYDDSTGTIYLLLTSDYRHCYDSASNTSTDVGIYKILSNPNHIPQSPLVKNITVFPNPARDEINIRFQNVPSHSTHLKLMDIKGSIVSESDFMGSEFRMPVAVPSGLYFLYIENEDNSAVFKVEILL